MRLRLYYVYILASVQRVLYVGVSGNLEKRLNEHWYRRIPTLFRRVTTVKDSSTTKSSPVYPMQLRVKSN